MSRIFLIALLAIATRLAAGPKPAVRSGTPPTGRDIVRMMHERYAGKWYPSFTFNQTTEVYRNDSLRSTATWYEFIRFPDRFRMDFGSADSGNAAIFRGDSCYRFRSGQLRSTTINNNEGLIFLLGGMFFYPLEKDYTIFDSLHYDLGKAHEDSWKGRPVYVIGANKGEDNVNQLYIDKQNLYPVRKKVYDLNLSRVISIQTAPQIRLIQNANQVLVEKNQSSIHKDHERPADEEQPVVERRHH
jgi:hypothetical protein